MKRLIAISASDWHFENWKQFNENGRRIDAHIHAWEELGEVAEVNDVPIIFCGDMFNNPLFISNVLFARVMPVLKDTRAKVIGIDGNHDQDSGSTFEEQPNSYFETLSKLFPQFESANLKTVIHEDLSIHGVPYISLNVGFEDYVNNIKLVKGKTNILIIHTDLPGALDTNNLEVGSVKGISAQYSKLFKRFDLVLSGHIHKFQQLASNVYMVGAGQQQRRTDRGCEMGYIEIYDDLSVEFKALKTPQFKTYKNGDSTDTYHYWDKDTNKKKKPKKRGKEVEVKKATNYKAIIKTYARDKNIPKVKTKKLIKLIERKR